MNPATIDTLRSQFSGEIILPSDAAYTQASTVFLRVGTPAVIMRPKQTQDVVAAIQFAKQNRLTLSIRSGGHSGAGFGTNDGGIVIDMTLMNAIELIDATNHVVRVGSGAHWIDVATKLKGHGLAISSGDTKTVGVGGLTLGGGIGWLVRQVGLTIDNLVRAELVTAAGEVLQVSESEHSDLFWAIRGGGGNFGIITWFEFRAYPLEHVYAGPISYGIDEVATVLKGWRDAMRTAPKELTTMALVMPSFAGNPPGVLILTCLASDDVSVLEPLKKLGKVVFDGIKQKSYADVLEDAHPPQGVEVITHVEFVQDFSDALIEEIARQCATQIPIIQIRYLGGAMNEVAADTTAFAHRDSEVLMVSPIFVPPGSSAEAKAKASEGWNKLTQFGKGTYANLLSSSTEDDVHAMYPPETYMRLAQVKKQYDPENLFNQNYNIKA